MTEVSEASTIAMLESNFPRCPFNETDPGDCEEESENIPRDDSPSVKVAAQQANNGGTLGRNLASGSSGKKGTTNDLYPFNGGKNRDPDKRIDSRRTNMKEKVTVVGDGTARRYTVAAHHLIPGEASLAPSKLFNYMYKKKPGSGTVDVRIGDQTKTFKIERHIGYNVNGAHNGVWLPGNYAIRKATSPRRGISWEPLYAVDPDWCFRYMAASVAKTSGQFHDSHGEYSGNVLNWLEKVTTALMNHIPTCQEDCKSKDKLLPPYAIKQRLYLLSAFLRIQLRGHPSAWKLPWITSDRFKPLITNADGTVNEKFLKAYAQAAPLNPKPS